MFLLFINQCRIWVARNVFPAAAAAQIKSGKG
jgi:hypothetical protein